VVMKGAGVVLGSLVERSSDLALVFLISPLTKVRLLEKFPAEFKSKI